MAALLSLALLEQPPAARGQDLLDEAGAGEGLIKINEIVTDPKQDWGDSSAAGLPFDSTPGGSGAAATTGDEWIELFNAGTSAVDLTGWDLYMEDMSPTTEVLGAGSAVLVFSIGATLASFPAGAYLVVGNPVGDLMNTSVVVLRNAADVTVDSVVLGLGGAPDSTANGGDAINVFDEAVARFPNGTDTDNDNADFRQQQATIGRSNDPSCTLDVDGNGKTSPLTDGLLALRYIFGFSGGAFSGAPLVPGAIGHGALRSDQAELEAYFFACLVMLDVDGNDNFEPLNDGVLILRYLFGFRGETLVQGAVGEFCTRCEFGPIEIQLGTLD